jgi:4-amino-4-deoxy-L-arabinose transferase-like glycosyltransferase
MSGIAPDRSVLTGDGSLSGSAGRLRGVSANAVAAAGFVLYVLAWTVHGAIVSSGASLHFDVLEAYAWGQEFQFGYNQHGPFWAWIAGAWFQLFPKANTSFVLLEALNAALGLWGAWRLTGLFASGPTRHAATLLLVATPLYTVMAFKYNANTIFVSLWPWTLFFFVRSLDRLSKLDALWFGIFAAFCILSKYYSIILLITCAASLLFHPNGRRYILSPLPWLAAAVFALLVLPHLLWALRNDAPPVAYAMSISGNGWAFTLGYAARFVLEIALYEAGPAAIILLAWLLPKKGGGMEPAETLAPPRRRFLAVLVLLPPLLTVIFGIAFQLKILPIMAVGTLPLMPLFLLQFAPAIDGRRLLQFAGGVALAVTLLAAAGAPLEKAAAAKRGGRDPHRELAAHVTELWHAETHLPLRYAGGTIHYTDGISFYSEDHPSSFPDLSYRRARWITPEKLKQYGLAIACLHQDTDCLGKAQGFLWGAWKQTSVKFERRGAKGTSVDEFDIFIVPPQSSAASGG